MSINAKGFCKEHAEEHCDHYRIKRNCAGCNAYIGTGEQQKKEWDVFKLQWMVDHGLSFKDITHAISQFITELCEEAREQGRALEDILNEACFEDWLQDRGFNGSLWPCYAEYIDCDQQ